MRRSRAGWLSLAGLSSGLALVILTLILTYVYGTSRYWPLLLIGLAIGCVSTPFYYYFKAHDKTLNPGDALAIKTLNKLGEQQRQAGHDRHQ